MTKKVAYVTGGVGGIGTEICRELAQKGMQVVAGYHPAEEDRAQEVLKEWQDQGLSIAVMAGDVTDFDDCANVAQKIESEFGPVDVLVNCAGITRDKTVKKMAQEDWHAVINVNLNSIFNVTKQFVTGMTERGFGRVINISSVNGQKGQFGQTNYSSSKAGMHGFTMALAQEVARKGVTVNTISPGYIETAMTAAIPEDITKQIVATIPAGRMGQPEEIGYIVGCLADERAGYLTGANIPVNGCMFTSF